MGINGAKIIIVISFLFSCTTRFKRENFSRDIEMGKKACDLFLDKLAADDLKASFKCIKGVNYEEFVKKSHIADSVFGKIVKYSYLNGESCIVTENGRMFGNYEMKYVLVRVKQISEVTLILEMEDGKFFVVGKNESKR